MVYDTIILKLDTDSWYKAHMGFSLLKEKYLFTLSAPPYIEVW